MDLITGHYYCTVVLEVPRPLYCTQLDAVGFQLHLAGGVVHSPRSATCSWCKFRNSNNGRLYDYVAIYNFPVNRRIAHQRLRALEIIRKPITSRTRLKSNASIYDHTIVVNKRAPLSDFSNQPQQPFGIVPIMIFPLNFYRMYSVQIQFYCTLIL